MLLARQTCTECGKEIGVSGMIQHTKKHRREKVRMGRVDAEFIDDSFDHRQLLQNTIQKILTEERKIEQQVMNLERLKDKHAELASIRMALEKLIDTTQEERSIPA